MSNVRFIPARSKRNALIRIGEVRRKLLKESDVCARTLSEAQILKERMKRVLGYGVWSIYQVRL